MKKMACLRTAAALALLGVAAGPAMAQDAAAPALPAAGVSSMMSGGRVSLQVGKSTIMSDVAQFSVGDSGVVDAVPGEEGKLILTGKSPGSTSLMITKTGMLGTLVFEVNVSGVDVENVFSTTKAALGGIVGLQVVQEGNVVVLQGDVANRDDGARIDKQKAVFGDTLLDLTKRTYMANGLNMLKGELSRGSFRDITAETQLNGEGVEVLMLRGTVYSDQQKQSLMAMAGRFFGESSIVDQVRVDSPLVEVDIEVYSLDLTRARQLGRNDLLSQISAIESTGWTFQTGPRLEIDANADLPTRLAADVTKHITSYPGGSIGAEISQSIEAFNNLGAVVNESKQHASVRSGQTASVQNVTEANIQIASGFAASLEQVTFGQVLNIAPVVLDENKFETNVSVELSNLVPSSGSDITVSRRQMSSVFVSNQGQTIVLGGNKQVTSGVSEESTPFLAHVPVVNWFFRDKNNQHIETVQVFLMTLFAPEITAAADPAQSKDASTIKERSINKEDENADFLRGRHRWEAEGFKKLFDASAPSRFD